jgi:hypothetical protein
MGLGSGIRTNPYSGSRIRVQCQKGTGSRIRIRNTACWFEKEGDDKGATGCSADPLMLKVNHGRSVLSRNLCVRVVDA